MYSEKVMEHFKNPRNVGEIPDADGIGGLVSEICGDHTYVYIKVKDGIISECKFQTFGCAAAIASSSMLTEMVIGKTLEEAMRITSMDIIHALDDGIPEPKIHCSVLAADSLHEAIKDFYSKQKKE
jgi:nitrogen fixation NifU-like protein